MELIYCSKKNKLQVDEIATLYRLMTYQELVDKVKELEEKGVIEPVKSRGSNGKHPSLYQAYRILRHVSYGEEWKKELLFLHPRLSNAYYLSNMKKYKDDRQYVLRVNEYLKRHLNVFTEAASYNERSFELFYREKFLTKEGGLRILNNLGLWIEDLNCYETTEPLAYYSIYKNVPQTVVFIENKDTYYTIRKKLLSGENKILGREIGTVIYGAGKGIYRSIKDLELCAEEHVGCPENEFLYFGDLDYEGILIYETVAAKMESTREIIPFVEAYRSMVRNAEGIDLPTMKEKQNHNIGERFFSYFSEEMQEIIQEILRKETYIPQEILQLHDL